MPGPGWTIRPIRRDEAAAFRELRLEALVNHPTAFSADPALFRALSPDEVAVRIPEPGDANVLFGAYAGDQLDGCAGFVREANAKETHKGFMWGVYLRMGFEVYGTEPRALRVDGRDYDEDLLVMVF